MKMHFTLFLKVPMLKDSKTKLGHKFGREKGGVSGKIWIEELEEVDDIIIL